MEPVHLELRGPISGRVEPILLGLAKLLNLPSVGVEVAEILC